MKSFGFMLHHGYVLYKGYVTASNKEEAEKMIYDRDWDDILDEYDIDDLEEGYNITEMWEC